MASSGGHILVPQAMRLIRYAFNKASRVVKDKLPQAIRTVEAQAEPAYARVSRQPVSRVAAIKQSQSRWYSTKQTINNGARHFSSRSGARASRGAYPSSRTATAISHSSAKTPFASQLRPNLTGGTLCRSAGGYSLGGGRAGARYFSHSPAAPAQVVNNVSQAVRAFWLSGAKARYDGFNPQTGEKRYRAVTDLQDEVRYNMGMSSPQAKGSFVDFKVSPTITAIGPLANVPRTRGSPTCEDVAEADTLNNTTLMSNLAVDFARALKDLAAIMNDLKHLSTLGDLPIALENSTTLRVRFPGCDKDTVESLCCELNIRRGIVGQDDGFDKVVGTEMALLFPFAPSKVPTEVDLEIRPTKRAKRETVEWQHMLSPEQTISPGFSHLSATSNDSEAILDGEIVENPWISSPSGYSSIQAPEDQEHDVAMFFQPTHQSYQAKTKSQATGYEGIEGIYRFLEECEKAGAR